MAKKTDKDRQERNRELIEITKREMTWKDKAASFSNKLMILGTALIGLAGVILAVVAFLPDPKGGRRQTIPVDVSDDETEKDEIKKASGEL